MQNRLLQLLKYNYGTLVESTLLLQSHTEFSVCLYMIRRTLLMYIRVIIYHERQARESKRKALVSSPTNVYRSNTDRGGYT